ncbi:MAG TPA: nucleotidyltransferase domain-containing protein [Candidatus Thermoplasmatota archaeon]|nr:nucleotidyltransferase domain-containing protein [Candidatus Thermoplasmatota archaeon]
MNPLPEPSGSRDEIIAILLAAVVGVGVDIVATRALTKQKAAPKPSIGIEPIVVPKSLKDIASEAHMQPPTALVHLRKLEEEGKLQKVATPDGPRYALHPFLRCEWLDPGQGVHETWQSDVAVDWRFPLVSRVRDDLAKQFLLEWLDRAQARGLLPAHASRFESRAKRPAGLAIVVYGSCARGDAGSNSDIDILVASDLPKRPLEALKALAHEVALKGGRRPDVRLVGVGLKGAGSALAETIRREGKTVFTNLPDAPFIESKVALLHAK